MNRGLSLNNLVVTGPAGLIVTRMDLHVEPGQTVALVGESGSGKSMTAKAMTGLLPRGVTATGSLQLDDITVDLALGPQALSGLRGQHISLLLQNPFTSLSPVHRCGEQITAALSPDLRRSKEEIRRRLDEVDLPERVARQYPFELSGGMRQRVALAASLASNPQILIGDEPTTALDVTTQREMLDLLARIQRERDMALLLITHDLGLARERADKILVMYAGRLVESGEGADVIAHAQHPYTAGLRDSDPPLEHRLVELPAIAGSVPRPWEVAVGCVFAPRCDRADDRCRAAAPELVGTTSQVACWKPITATDARRPIQIATDIQAQNTDDDLVVIRGLSKRFSSSAPLALDNVDISIRSGEAVGIVGESGSGKTTLARCLIGLESFDSGNIAWSINTPMAQRAQIVFQDPTSALNPAMTIGATLAEALRAGQRSKAEVVALLQLVGLPSEYVNRRPSGLSGGEQQRVAIARAIAPRPKLLICDEPVSSLDVSVQAQILNLMNSLLKDLGIALLFITHDLAVVRQVVSRVYVMSNGQVVESGNMENVLQSPQHEYTRQLFSSVAGK
jgi:peptide/nickel transport system ATP-binding protein